MFICSLIVSKTYAKVTSWALKTLILLELYEKYKLMSMHLSDKCF